MAGVNGNENQDDAPRSDLPLPVRSGLRPARTDPEPAPAPPADEDPRVTLELDGVPWEVSVAGRALGGAALAPVPLLLLAFTSLADPGLATRETLLVARGLGELSEQALAEAFAVSRPEPTPGGPKPLFPEIVTKGDRRDG